MAAIDSLFADVDDVAAAKNDEVVRRVIAKASDVIKGLEEHLEFLGNHISQLAEICGIEDDIDLSVSSIRDIRYRCCSDPMIFSLTEYLRKQENAQSQLERERQIIEELLPKSVSFALSI